ncbi:hypothetical protein [Millisia brevis]|uniref:hypothetical protein n=1 Tax=Millisia brevis TaxID=264148 RepID=UPI0008320217|nr:hypothetical protein [Millisia brevis]
MTTSTTQTGQTQRPADRRPPLRAMLSGSATPNRLRLTGLVLVVGCLVFALVGLVSGSTRSAAVADAGDRLAALDADVADLYRSLAGADAAATSAFVAGGQEPAHLRARFDDDILRISRVLVSASARLEVGDPALDQLTVIATNLPVYTALMDSARTYNRQELPLGQSYLDNASSLMRDTMLPAAERVRDLQTVALEKDFVAGGGFPFAVVLIGLAVLLAMGDVARQELRRTNRRLSPALMIGAAAMGLAVLWWMVAGYVSAGHLDRARDHSTAIGALDDMRTELSQARSIESLVLVARSGSASDTDFGVRLVRVLNDGGLLDTAATQMPDDEVADLRAAIIQWDTAHRQLRARDDRGDYRAAVDSSIGVDSNGSGPAFERVDALLVDAAEQQRAQFVGELSAAQRSLTGFAVVPTVLALIAAVAAGLAVARRVGEFR